MLKTEKRSTLQEILIVLVGGMLLGMLWRARGEHGWGSEEGILMVGFVYTLFVTAVVGQRQKMDMGWFALTVSSFVITTPAWGTLLSQMTGILRASANVDDTVLYADISAFSGVFIMLCLGFGMAPLFGVLLGRGYSDKQWKIRDIVVLLVVFFAVDLLTKASVSHWILQLVQPQAAELFEEGLAKAGIEGSAYSVYMEHFGSIGWGKKIHGGRNYFSEVQVVTNALKTVATLLVVRFAIKDKTAARIGAVVCGAFAVSITVADLFFFFTKGGFRNAFPEYTGTFIYAWSNWEYFTGFIAGVIITAVLLRMKKKDDVPELVFAKVPDKLRTGVSFAGFAAIIAVNIILPLIGRFDLSDTSTAIAAVIGVVLAAAVLVLFVRFFGLRAEKTGMQNMARGMLLFFTAFISIVYLFASDAQYRNILELDRLHNIFVLLSAVCCIALSCVQAGKIKQKKA